MPQIGRHTGLYDHARRCATAAAALVIALSSSSHASGETLASNTLGIQVQVTEKTQVTGKNAPGEPPFLLLRGGGDTPRWSLRLEQIQSDEPDARSLLIELLGVHQEADRDFEVVSQSQIPVDKELAEVAWVTKITQEGHKLAFGTMVLKGKDDRWLVGSVVTLPADLEWVKEELIPIFSSIRPLDRTLSNLNREGAMAKGQALLKSITEEDLRRFDGFRQLRRIHQPGEGTDAEIGYSLIEGRAALRGVIMRHRNPKRYTQEEMEEGLLVTEHGRFILDRERKIYIDILALQWISWDLQREAWNITATRRQGVAQMTETEIGFRTEPCLGSPLPTLHVIKEDPDINLRQPYEWTVPDGWLPRPLSSLLSYLVPNEPASYGFYAYESSGTTPGIMLRLDTWQPDPSNSSRKTLESRVGEGALPTRASFDRNGALLRVFKPDGSIIEPSTAEEVQRRWSAAGFETE
ncbi:MAG: hypothetical protein MK095_03765 [Phycisphaerales bacterium]|nr:hypothetical protein [Phycisphaerales bacterium]